MPTILFRKGWRIFFYANEGSEPMHVHCKKGNANAKFWIYPDVYDIASVYVRYMTRSEERELRRILFEHLDEIIEAWNAFKTRKYDE